MNTVDHVAEAIYQATPQWGSLWDKTEKIKDDYRLMAVAAIDAMREPIREMIDARIEAALSSLHSGPSNPL